MIIESKKIQNLNKSDFTEIAGSAKKVNPKVLRKIKLFLKRKMTELIFKTISVNNRHHKNTTMNTVMIGTYNFETSVIL